MKKNNKDIYMDRGTERWLFVQQYVVLLNHVRV